MHYICLSDDCYVAVRGHETTTKPLGELDFNNTCRNGSLGTQYSKVVFDEANPRTLLFHSNEVSLGKVIRKFSVLFLLFNFEMYLILQEWSRLEARLTISLADSSVKVPLNLHLDDSSMVASKMWKSGSVVGIQASEI